MIRRAWRFLRRVGRVVDLAALAGLVGVGALLLLACLMALVQGPTTPRDSDWFPWALGLGVCLAWGGVHEFRRLLKNQVR